MSAIQARLDPRADNAVPRSAVRRKLCLQAQGSMPSDRTSVTVLDISRTGFLLDTPDNLDLNERIEIELPGAASVAAIVKWSDGNLYGCQFKQPVSDAFVSAALLRAPPIRPHVQGGSPSLDDAERAGRGDKFSTRVRLGLHIGMALLCWAAIGGGLWLATN